MIKWSLEKKVFAGFVLALMMLVGVGYLSLQNITALIDNDRWVSHTYIVLSEANASTAALQSLSDTLLPSERNFANSGSQPSLQPIQQDINEVSLHVRQLGQLTIDNPVQQPRVAAMQSSLLNLQSLLLNLVTTYTNQGPEATSRVIAQNVDTTELQNLRSTLAAIQATENSLLQQRTLAAQNSMYATTAVMITAVVMVFIFLSISYYFIRRDVSQRRKAEEALQKETALYESTLQAQSDLGEGVLVVRGDKIIYVNDALCELVGYSHAELRDVSALSKLAPSNSTAPGTQAVQGAEQDRGIEPFQDILINKNGKPIDIESSTKVLEIEGTPGSVTVIRNISVRKEAQKALKESETRFRRFSEASREGIMIHHSGKVVEANQAGADMFGYSHDELVGKDVYSLLTPVSEQTAREKVKAGSEEPYEVYGLRKDRSIFPLEICGRSMPFEGIVMRVSTFRDLTDRKRMEEAVLQSERDYRGLFENARDAILVLAPENELVLDANSAACELYGFSREEFIGMSMVALSVDPNSIPTPSRSVLEHGGVMEFETSQYRKDGTQLEMEVHASIIDYKGRRAVLSVNRDVTERRRSEQALAESESRFRLLAENMNDMVALIAPTGQYLYASPSSKQHLGYEPQELLDLNVFRLVFPEDAAWVQQEFNRALASHDTSITLTFRMCTKGDGYIWVENLARFMYDPQGELVNIQVTSRDVTERKRAEEALVASEKKFRLLIQGATDGVVLLDRKGNYTDANGTACRVLGYTHDELLSLNASQVIAPEDLARRPLILDRRDARKGVLVERLLVRKDGSRLPVEISGTILDDGTMQAIVRDVTERKRAEEALHELATLDPLTGLLNRREMDRVLEEEVTRGRRYANKLSVVMVDLDHFKTVNDRYGHKVGDEVIRWAGRMFGDHVRTTDRVARYGGEELALILPETCLEDACRMAERFRVNFAARPFTTVTPAGKTLEIPITASMGVAELPRSGATAEALLIAADTALYQAKQLGRNRVVPYDATLSEFTNLRTTGKLEAALVP